MTRASPSSLPWRSTAGSPIDVEAQLDEQTAGEWETAWARLASEVDAAYEDATGRQSCDPRIVPDADRERLDNSLSVPELPAELQAIWVRVRDEADWLSSVDTELAAARRLTEAVDSAREARALDDKGRLIAKMRAAAVVSGYTVDLTPSSDYDADNSLGNDLEAEAKAATPVPAVPTLDELRSADQAMGEG